MYTILCQPRHKEALYSNLSVNTFRKRITTDRIVVRPADILQNGAALMWTDRVETKNLMKLLFLFIFHTKVFSCFITFRLNH